MPKSERHDAKVSETRDPDLVTLLRHENSHNSATTNAHATSRISSGRCRLEDARLQVASDSARNCMSYGLSEVRARRAASHRRGTARWNATKLREVIEMLDESRENEESGKNAHPFPRYPLNRLIPHCTLRKTISPQRTSASARKRYHQVAVSQ
ncbi:hypothetical protein EDD16DRAFT_1233049 [Pisolithus croceorrhizus]|nr:hypothetical protein EDD16DRAFT_1233049 [Pisolithus croceorrhizus]